MSTDISSLCSLRTCFDHSSSEWNETSLDEKVSMLKKQINDNTNSTFKLSLGMLDYCNTEAGKDIKPLDLVISMSKIIDHLLKEKQ